MKKIFIISGEKSGDLIAEEIIQSIREKFPDIQIKGIGGESFQKNKLKSLFPQEEISIMGFLEIIPKLKRMFQLFSITKKAIHQFKPEHIITIDSPGFNFRVAKFSQNARLSKKEVRNIFLQYSVKKSKAEPAKIIRLIHQLYQKTVSYIATYTEKYRITSYIIKLFKWIIKFGKFFDNRLTKLFWKIFTLPMYFILRSSIIRITLLSLFGHFVGIIVLLEAFFVYINTFRFMRYPYMIAKTLYNKILRHNEAQKDLNLFYRTLILQQLHSKNTMYCNAIVLLENIYNSLPTKMRFKFLSKIIIYVKKFYKKFKKQSYDNAFECKIHHIVAPSVWAYKKNRAKKVASLYDTLFCILPFEPPYFEKYSLKTIFIGYPPYARMKNILNNINADIKSNQITVTIGSRKSELKHHIPAIKQVLIQLNKQYPNKLSFKIISLPHLSFIIQSAFVGFKNVEIVSDEKKWEVVKSSLFVIAKSGTNVMEFALLGVPSIVYYKASLVTASIIKMLIYNRMGTLLNITAGRFILPEFIQENTKNIHTKAIEWIENPQKLDDIKKEMEKELEKFSSVNRIGEIVLENLQ